MRNIFEKPNIHFVEKAKEVFLAAYREKFPLPHAGLLWARYFVRGFASGVALMLVFGGASVYADERNVSTRSAFYPLKRFSEAIQVVLSSEEEKPALHLKLAERRLGELLEIKKENPESPKISKLRGELKEEVAHSLAAVPEEVRGGEGENEKAPEAKVPKTQKTGIQTTPLLEGEQEAEEFHETVIVQEAQEAARRPQHKRAVAICRSFQAFIQGRPPEEGDIAEHELRLLEKFEKKCAPFTLMKNDEEVFDERRQGRDEHIKTREDGDTKGRRP